MIFENSEIIVTLLLCSCISNTIKAVKTPSMTTLEAKQQLCIKHRKSEIIVSVVFIAEQSLFDFYAKRIDDNLYSGS